MTNRQLLQIFKDLHYMAPLYHDIMPCIYNLHFQKLSFWTALNIMHYNILISRLVEYANCLPLFRLSYSQKYGCAWASSDRSKEYFQNIQLFFLRKCNSTLNNLISLRTMAQKPPVKNSTILFELSFTIFSFFSNPLILFIWITGGCAVWIMSGYNYPELGKVNKLKLDQGKTEPYEHVIFMFRNWFCVPDRPTFQRKSNSITWDIPWSSILLKVKWLLYVRAPFGCI